jgi:hypothetical protein
MQILLHTHTLFSKPVCAFRVNAFVSNDNFIFISVKTMTIQGLINQNGANPTI